MSVLMAALLPQPPGPACLTGADAGVEAVEVAAEVEDVAAL